MDNKDKKRLVFNSWLCLFGRATEEGVISGSIGNFKINLEEVKRRVRTSANAGSNGMTILLYAPWGITKLEEFLCPFTLEGNKYNMRKYNLEYDLIFVNVIKTIMELIPENFMLEICYIDNCQMHHDAPNPYLWKDVVMNKQGYRRYYDMTYADHCAFIDHIEGLIKPWTTRIRRKVGNELPVLWNGTVQVQTPLGKVTIPNSVKLIYDLGRYLYEKKGVPANMIGWGGIPGKVEYINDEFIVDEKTSMHVQLDRIANRMDPAFAKEVLVEVHGACSGYKEENIPQPSFWSRLSVDFYGNIHTRHVDFSNDGDNCKNPKYASPVDKLPNGLYCRYNEDAHYDVYSYIFKNNKADRQFKVETLPQSWDDDNGIVNFKAIAQAYKDEYGIPLYNTGKYPKPVPECKIGETRTEICWDGSEIITHTCENGKWVETGNICPPEPTDCHCRYYLDIHKSWFGIGDFIKCIFGKIEKPCK